MPIYKVHLDKTSTFQYNRSAIYHPFMWIIMLSFYWIGLKEILIIFNGHFLGWNLWLPVVLYCISFIPLYLANWQVNVCVIVILLNLWSSIFYSGIWQTGTIISIINIRTQQWLGYWVMVILKNAELINYNIWTGTAIVILIKIWTWQFMWFVPVWNNGHMITRLRIYSHASSSVGLYHDNMLVLSR